MTYSHTINAIKALEWELSYRAMFGMCMMIKLNQWATPVYVEGKVYYLLYRSKLLEEIPMVGISKPTASKIIKELEDKGLIESINKSTKPAYRVTDKGWEWTSDTKREKSNAAEKDLQEKNDKPTNPSEFTFELKISSPYKDLSKEYQTYLKNGCLVYLKEIKLPTSTYDDFVNRHRSTGTCYVDWRYAFKSWCSTAIKLGEGSNSKAIKNSNAGENYTLDGMEL